jgi:hypothetical protein
MVYTCNNIPFLELGFVQTDENLWVKYTDQFKSVPQFVISTTINPVSQTFLIKDLLHNKTMSTNSYGAVREFVISYQREDKLKKLLD